MSVIYLQRTDKFALMGHETKIFTKTGSLLLNQKGKGKVLTQYIRSILFPICFIKTQVPMLINLWEKKNVGTY